MTPWVERPSADGGPATHALVIGGSRYDNLPAGEDDPAPPGRETFGLRQARTPVTSVWRFASWLADEYSNPKVPHGTIRLLVSPSEWETQTVAELATLPAEVIPAMRENVAEAVDEWFQKAEDAARENAQDAANGRALAEAINAEATPEAGGGGASCLESLGAGSQRDVTASVAARHAELAKRLFP